MQNNIYEKLFISEIKGSLKDENSESNSVKTLMKAHILGILIGIQKFSRKTIFSVDDGTGILDCVLWHHESASTSRIGKCLIKLNSESATHSNDLDDICQVLINKVQVNEEEIDYKHGEVMSCLGHVKFVKGKLLLDINHHYKADDVNAESLWILDAVLCH